jgi:hypothetical protein
VNNKVKLSFNHPVKELIFVVQPETFTTKQSIVGDCRYGLEHFNFTDDYEGVISQATMDAGGAQINEMPGIAAGGTFNTLVPVYFGSGQNPVAFAKLQLNGHDRFAEREGMYFNLVQPYQHHENVPKLGINVYSFCLKPEEHQPSGSCNFSRIDSATVNLTLTKNTVQPTCACPLTGAATSTTRTAKIKFFAVSYNVLRVMSGMGGLALTLLLSAEKWLQNPAASEVTIPWYQPRDISRCGKTLTCRFYQGNRANGSWPRGASLGYGKNETDLGDPQALLLLKKAFQRLNGNGSRLFALDFRYSPSFYGRRRSIEIAISRCNGYSCHQSCCCDLARDMELFQTLSEASLAQWLAARRCYIVDNHSIFVTARS